MYRATKPGIAPDLKTLVSILGPGFLISAGVLILIVYALAWFLGW